MCEIFEGKKSKSTREIDLLEFAFSFLFKSVNR